MHLPIWFLEKTSTDFYLSCLNDKILKGFDKGLMIGMILIDLQKAFDTIDHDILLQKLYAIGFSKHTVNCFQSYLPNFQLMSEIIFLNLHLYPAVYLKVLFWDHSYF